MNNKAKILKYLERVTNPKTYAEIAKGAKVNYNSVRRDMNDLWNRGVVDFVSENPFKFLLTK